MFLLVLRRWWEWWDGRRFDGDIDGLIYRVEVDQKLMAVVAGLKVAILILFVLFGR